MPSITVQLPDGPNPPQNTQFRVRVTWDASTPGKPTEMGTAGCWIRLQYNADQHDHSRNCSGSETFHLTAGTEGVTSAVVASLHSDDMGTPAEPPLAEDSVNVTPVS